MKEKRNKNNKKNGKSLEDAQKAKPKSQQDSKQKTEQKVRGKSQQGGSTATKQESTDINKPRITKNSTLAEILTIPGAYEELAKLGVPCMVCPLMGAEMHFLTLEAICNMYKLDLEKILKKLGKLDDK